MTTQSIQIRPAEAADLPAILEIHRQAFPGPYEATLVRLLHKAKQASPSIVAVTDGAIVGHILFSPVTLEPAIPGFRASGLAPLAVLPAFQRRGIGSLLADAGIRACREEGYDAVVVLGGPAYYSRFGFSPAMSRGITNEYVTDEHFMIMELQLGSLAGVTGLIRYTSAFRDAE